MVPSADMWLNKLKKISHKSWKIMYLPSCVIPFTAICVKVNHNPVSRLFQLLSKAEKILILVSGDTRLIMRVSRSSCCMKSPLNGGVIYLFYIGDALVSQDTRPAGKLEREMINTEFTYIINVFYHRTLCVYIPKACAACSKLMWLSESRAKSITNSITQMMIVICDDCFLFPR